MVSNSKASTSIQPIVRKDTDKAIGLLNDNRQHILDLWIEVIREEFNEPESRTNEQLADHMIYIIDALVAELRRFANDPEYSKSTRQGDMRYDAGVIEDQKDGGEKHGKQRAGLNAYNVDKVFWEYVELRKIIVRFLQEHRLLDIDHSEIITCVIESCSRESLNTFTGTLQKMQSKLLGSIIHDIRNPLNAISMMGEYIAMIDDADKSKKFAGKIVASTGRVSNMLEDMLLTLSAESGQGLKLDFDMGNVNKLISATALEARVLYGTRLKLNLQRDDINAIYDEIMLKRVIENLISNAFKYGDRVADVTITVTETDKLVIIDVHNFGNPIEQDRISDIFLFLKRFEGQEDIKTRSWGIGLALVKAVIEGHKGSVTVSSEATRGTRFLIEFPKYAFEQGDSISVPI